MGLFDHRGPFRRIAAGRYAVQLSGAERRLLRDQIAELRSLLGTDSEALVRLFPQPYGDDEERNAGYAVLAGTELLERRLAAIEVIEATVDGDELTEDELGTWMRSINDLRLVLGTILDVSEDDEAPDPDDELAALHAVYEYLGFLLERIVAALVS